MSSDTEQETSSPVLVDDGESPDEEEEEESNDGGVLFYQNRNGIPLDEKTWERMWIHAAKINPDANTQIMNIRDQTTFIEVSHFYASIMLIKDYIIAMRKFGEKCSVYVGRSTERDLLSAFFISR